VQQASACSAVLRSCKDQAQGCVARHTILAMVWMLGEVIRGVQLKDGEQIDPLNANADEFNRAVV